MENLRIIREKRGKNQLNVALKVGVAQEMISSYESGRSFPSAKVLIKLAKYLETSTDYLLGLTDDPTPIRLLGENNLSEEETELLNRYAFLAEADKLRLAGYMDALISFVNN